MKNYRYKIYIADDNPQYLELMASRLRGCQTDVNCFPHGNPLLLALAERPDIVVLDHRFGDDEAGIELLRKIKAHDPTIQVILVSGQKRVEVAIEAIKAGASDYLEKNGNELHALEESVARIIHFENEKRHQRLGIFSFFAALKNWSRVALLFATLLVLMSGCAPRKQGLHTKLGGQDRIPAALTQHSEHVIGSDDKVSLSIWNNDDVSVGSVFGIYNSNEVYGKWVLVDQVGDAMLPMIGKVHLAGKSTSEAEAWLQTQFGKEIKEPVVVVRVLNREVTVTGEVKEPGNFILDKEKHTFAEILGKAEGLTDYAKLKKVTLTRRTEKEVAVFPLDLRKMSGTDLSRIYIRKGDVIDIPERAGKRLERKMPLLIPLASLATSIGVLISVTRKPE